MFKNIRADIRAVKEKDPAARNAFEIFFLYSGFHALVWYRLSHWFWKLKLRFIARMLSQLGRFFTGVEIHPAAKIGKGVFIDHGMGIVIGETAEVGDYCVLFQNITLGGTGKDTGKRHPTLGCNVTVGAGAKVLGPFKVGDNSKIAANAVVLEEVPPNSTAVGVPARIVKRDGVKITSATDMDHIHIPDPVAQELCRLALRIEHLEKQLKEEKNETV